MLWNGADGVIMGEQSRTLMRGDRICCDVTEGDTLDGAL